MKETNIRYKSMLWTVYKQSDFICQPRGMKIKEKLMMLQRQCAQSGGGKPAL